MAYPDLTFRHVPPDVLQELEQFVAILNGYLAIQHDSEGAHTDITALSVTVEGEVFASGDGIFEGDVSAQSGATVLGLAGSALVTDGLLGHGLHAQSLTAGQGEFEIVATDNSTDEELQVQDLVRNLVPFTIHYNGTAYYVRPGKDTTVSKNVNLGTDQFSSRRGRFNSAFVNTLDTRVLNATGTVEPAQITSNQNDYNPTDLATASHLRLSSDAARDITGLVAQEHGRLLMISNGGGTFNITLKVNSGSSSAANRFAIANGADVVLRPNNGSVLLRYDSTIGSGFWFVIGA